MLSQMDASQSDEYEREHLAISVARDWLASTYGSDHWLATQASRGDLAGILSALLATTQTTDRPEYSAEVLEAWGDLLTAARRYLALAEVALREELRGRITDLPVDGSHRGPGRAHRS